MKTKNRHVTALACVMLLGSVALSPAAVVYHTGVVATASTEEGGAGGTRLAAHLTDYSGFDFPTMTVTSTQPNSTMWNTNNGVTKEATWVMFDLGKVTEIVDMIVFNYNGNFFPNEANRRFITADVWWTASTPTVTNPTVGTPGNWTRLLDDQAFAAASYNTSYNTPTEVTLNLSAARYVLMNDVVNGGSTDWGNSYGLSEVLFTAIPEPGSLGMLGVAATALLLRRKIRR